MKKKFSLLLLILASCSNGNLTEHEKVVSDITYLDYAASSQTNEAALSEFKKISRMNGNSSGINSHAKMLKNIENRSARIIAEKISAKSKQIVFTSSASISNNIVILGIAYKNPQCHFITSKIEHKSVLNVFKHLEDNGYSVTYLDVDSRGNVNLDQLQKSIRRDTKLISIQMLNSEIGVLQNIKVIGEIAKDNGILFHSDAAQAFCKYHINVDDMNLDFLTISGHKIGSPKGIAALYVRDRSKLQPILFGSGDDLFPGTKPTALIAAFAAAVDNFHFDRKKVEHNFNLLVSELLKIDGVHINSALPSHIVSISIEGVLLRDILGRMTEYSFSAGCSCLGERQSNVILAIDPDEKLPSCTLRISFSDTIESADLITFAQKLKSLVEQLRREKTITTGCSADEKMQNDLIRRFEKIQKILSLTKTSSSDEVYK